MVKHFSLWYEPWYVRNPDIFIIRGIFSALEYLKIRRYLDPCQTYCKIFGKKVQAVIIFAGHSFLDHFRCLAGFMYLQMLLCMYSNFRFCFGQDQAYSSIIQEHTHAYFLTMYPCVSLEYSKPWHISIPNHIQIPRYIYNTLLNIFTKLHLGRLIQFWTRLSLLDAM